MRVGEPSTLCLHNIRNAERATLAAVTLFWGIFGCAIERWESAGVTIGDIGVDVTTKNGV